MQYNFFHWAFTFFKKYVVFINVAVHCCWNPNWFAVQWYSDWEWYIFQFKSHSRVILKRSSNYFYRQVFPLVAWLKSKIRFPFENGKTFRHVLTICVRSIRLRKPAVGLIVPAWSEQKNFDRPEIHSDCLIYFQCSFSIHSRLHNELSS